MIHILNIIAMFLTASMILYLGLLLIIGYLEHKEYKDKEELDKW